MLHRRWYFGRRWLPLQELHLRCAATCIPINWNNAKCDHLVSNISRCLFNLIRIIRMPNDICVRFDDFSITFHKSELQRKIESCEVLGMKWWQIIHVGRYEYNSIEIVLGKILFWYLLYLRTNSTNISNSTKCIYLDFNLFIFVEFKSQLHQRTILKHDVKKDSSFFNVKYSSYIYLLTTQHACFRFLDNIICRQKRQAFSSMSMPRCYVMSVAVAAVKVKLIFFVFWMLLQWQLPDTGRHPVHERGTLYKLL